jgi:hypothetical protein
MPRFTLSEGVGSSGRRSRVRLAYIDARGLVVELSEEERDWLIERDPDVRREVVKWSRMRPGGNRDGRVILLGEPVRFETECGSEPDHA